MKNSSVLNLRNIAVTCALALGTLASSVAHAQTQPTAVKVDVPFAFVDGSKHLPAGIYRIDLQSEHMMLVRGASRNTVQYTMTNPDERITPYGTSKVVFHRYGDQYFLSEVWIAGNPTGHRCLPTKSEKELQVAKNPEAPSNNEIALNALPQ